ncbi:MAG: DNA polymerase III subunit gamma/tau [Gammaproteobacteria bacterium]|nr:DNA polymerase III subunit gamma/tau [Gammaproteobacteria bacterium]NIR84414.1 DNA polymerase III subunit gamma/tau [Gammaproteobacteria bacterium]NIR90895.1 DNA polymerase III subunit gamma/tau [Gammaproteobacteria bacterium]NIU07081.1 DNA polymerase III subunit gamma/tau [Gammaproteobacteria bacterium]NIV76210.1 DNA polymerase III subunit gamma/tau [Gammaproteobacteria bacterium]
MSYQVLARKWRPREFEQVIGQSHIVRALRNALDGERLHHAFLFTGTRGVGKTTLARILAKCLNCERGVGSRPCGECASCRELDEGRFVDLIEVDAASRAKVEETRELMDNVQFAPTRGRYKVYLIDEVHMFSEKSFNTLLKTLEEPPPHVKFLLATTDPQKLPVTVLSRCLQFNLKRLPVKAIVGHLTQILESEGVPAPEAHAVRLIAEAADGSMRDALSLLDQAIAYGNGQLEAAAARAMLGTLGVEHVHGMLETLAAGDGAGLMERVDTMAAEAVDFEEVLGELLSELQRIALAQIAPEALDEDVPRRDAVLALAQRMSPEDVQLYYQIGVMGRRDLPFAPDPRGGFEMILLRMLAFHPGGLEGSTSGAAPSSKTVPGAARRPAGAEAAPAPSSTPLPLRRDTWVQVVDAMGLTGLARELAVNSSLREQRGEVLSLQLAPAHAQLTARNVKDKLQAALSEYYGTPILLRFDIATPEDETPAGIQRRDADERRRAALEAIETDPNVRAIVERFGASIDEGSVRPGDG